MGAAALKNGELLAGMLTKAGFEGEAAFVDAVKKAHPGIGEKEVEAVVGSMRLLKGFSDSEAVKKTASLVEAVAKGEMPPGFKKKTEEEGDGEEPDGDEAEVEMKKGLPADVVKSLEAFPKEQRPAMAAIFKAGQASAAAASKEAIAKAEKDAAAAKADAAKSSEILKAERDERRGKEFVAKAETAYKFVPGMSSAELGAVLKSADDLSPALREKIETIFKSVNDTLEKSQLFIEKGKSGSGGGSTGDSLEAIEKAAGELKDEDEDLE